MFKKKLPKFGTHKFVRGVRFIDYKHSGPCSIIENIFKMVALPVLAEVTVNFCNWNGIIIFIAFLDYTDYFKGSFIKYT